MINLFTINTFSVFLFDSNITLKSNFFFNIVNKNISKTSTTFYTLKYSFKTYLVKLIIEKYINHSE